MNNKLLFGTIAGAVTFFFLGFMIYGLALAPYISANTNQCLAVADDQLNLGVLAFSNLLTSFLIALFIQGSSNLMQAIGKGSLFGLLYASGVNLNSYAMTTMYQNFTVLMVDVAAFMVLSTATAACIYWVMGKVK